MHSEQQINDLLRSVEEVKSLSIKAASSFNNVMTPELEREMSEQQRQFMNDSKSVFNDRKMSNSEKIKRLQDLMKVGEKII